jgi:hypothetical protein
MYVPAAVYARKAGLKARPIAVDREKRDANAEQLAGMQLHFAIRYRRAEAAY